MAEGGSKDPDFPDFLNKDEVSRMVKYLSEHTDYHVMPKDDFNLLVRHSTPKSKGNLFRSPPPQPYCTPETEFFGW